MSWKLRIAVFLIIKFDPPLGFRISSALFNRIKDTFLIVKLKEFSTFIKALKTQLSENIESSKITS